jgi:UDP-3-O-[3-hydroxymyristoyl] glucosamine N-acyltransferase
MIRETVGGLASLVGGVVHGDPAVEVTGVADLRAAGDGKICFVRSRAFQELARASRAAALLVGEVLEVEQPQIVVADVEVAFARVAERFHPPRRAVEHRVHARAEVDASAKLEAPVEVGPFAVVERGARVGAGTLIAAGVVIGPGVVVGRACVLHPRVVLYPGTTLGDRVTVHAGTVIGADGFGYAVDRQAAERGAWIKVPQMGVVEVGDDVEIGANSTIDRATLGATRIGAGTKIDNLCHIGHNCVLGRHNVIAGFSAFSGSTVFGDRVSCAGHVVSGGHLKVADDVRIGGNSVLLADVTESGDYMGYPLQPLQRWGRSRHILARLVELNDRVRTLEGTHRDREAD